MVGGIHKKVKLVAVPGFEPGLPDSKSGVLTTTLYRKKTETMLNQVAPYSITR